MRIAHVLPHGWSFAGWSLEDIRGRYHVSKHIAEIVARRGHEVRLFMVHEDLRRSTREVQGRVTLEVHPIRARIPLVQFGGDLSSSLLRGLQAYAPDLIHYHQYRTAMFPVVETLRSSPLVAQYHGGRMRPVERFLLRPFIQRTEAFLVPQRAVGEELRGAMGVPANRIFHVPLPLRAESRMLAARVPPSGPPRLLYVGRIPAPGGRLEERDPFRLLRILAELSRRVDATLWIVGDGPGMGALRESARSLGVADRVEFTGYLPLADWQDRFHSAALSMVPCVVPELDGSWGSAIQESLAIAVPVTAFSERNSLEDQPFGWKIPYAEGPAADALSRILADPGTIREKGVRGGAHVRATCTEDAVGARLERVYSFASSHAA